jgi:hypothetical protein
MLARCVFLMEDATVGKRNRCSTCDGAADRVEIRFNGKVANARGLELPTGPLARANGVIE